MSSAWSWRAALGCFLLLGCKAGSAAPGPPAPADAGPLPLAALSFDIDPGLACADGGLSGICVAPSQTVTFQIDGTIDGPVSLSLDGTYADAALAADQVEITGGHAKITLQAASVPGTFSVVARDRSAAMAPVARVPVLVSQAGMATVQATPSYGGHRPTPTFYATDYPTRTCAEIAAVALQPDAGVWTSAPAGIAIALPVFAGDHVAIDVRVGHYASGCADVSPLVPNETSAVPVQVFDVPMALGATNLTATFTLDATSSAKWSAVARVAASRVDAAFFASAEADGSALLDAMRGAIASATDQAQFDQLRAQGGWDAVAASWLSARAPSLRSRAQRWLTAAVSDGPGALVVHIGGTSPSGVGTAAVTVSTLGALSAASAGVAQPAPFDWTADANDTVHLSGAIDLTSTPLLAHEADVQAAAGVSGATDVPSAIAIVIDCAGLAASLVGSGVLYGTCNAACAKTVCGSGLTQAWTAASAADPGGADAVHATITASAPADVGDLAEPSYLEGGWLGVVSTPTTSFMIDGDLIAIEPSAP